MLVCLEVRNCPIIRYGGSTCNRSRDQSDCTGLPSYKTKIVGVAKFGQSARSDACSVQDEQLLVCGRMPGSIQLYEQ
jgi:hypothetical protein